MSSKNDSEVLKALRTLLFEVEEMHEGARPFAERNHPEEYFGPFSAGAPSRGLGRILPVKTFAQGGQLTGNHNVITFVG